MLRSRLGYRVYLSIFIADEWDLLPWARGCMSLRRAAGAAPPMLVLASGPAMALPGVAVDRDGTDRRV